MSITEKQMVESIREEYVERKATKLDELQSLDRKVARPAEIFAYTFGSAGSLVLGTGMCLAMKQIGASLAYAMPLGIGIGLVGIAMVSATYFLYKKILTKRKKKYAPQILALTDELLNK